MIHCYVCSNQIQNPTNHTQGMLSELSMLHELTNTLEQVLKFMKNLILIGISSNFLCNTKAYTIVHDVLSNQYITIMQNLYIFVL